MDDGPFPMATERTKKLSTVVLFYDPMISPRLPHAQQRENRLDENKNSHNGGNPSSHYCT
jgi:hypothetical protein